MQFEPEWRDLYAAECFSSKTDGASTAIMADDKLFFVFMYRIYRDKLIIGADCLEKGSTILL